ncbi:exodeoxyribonuclease V subunit beta [Chromobacterium violaceum]|uniref:exodeoxyribonuclease V subunit beta n=1 Tax=Chromobacterium violaceum TaxID=536 RepID=UPI00065447E5|nr:exodeoxyribonuclease V subunit beta [Chromobacterium violaceum]KMN48071.1 exodeoxyribonuclease V subunit beta [Chromobacterium violaceum]KMN86462.1 exodeoxyribonuclease V subunit beta [Chromobacterium violaceum]KMN89945.1 exodeoxyribonuclease V subunit beta [Chromobacterium violaceum]KMO02141.1 exodeoxyribonuclease V subunit beta [Chromobacterium violaceum]
MNAPQALDALNCPLQGVNLIEASAGTGKTWTIAALFARLLLEERDGAPPPAIERILVVTYTKAATAELRERLRRRLAEMLALLDGKADGDDFLRALAARFPEGPARDVARQRLTAAVNGFDAAAIYTIHGFCQRVLTDAAFESGQTFQAELVEDDAARLAEIVDDFWRRRIVAAPLLAQVLVERGETPDAWLAEIRPYLSKPYLKLRAPDAVRLENARWVASERWRLLASAPEQVEEGLALFLAHPGFKANIYRPDTMARAADNLRGWLAQPDALPELDSDSRKLLDKLRPEALAKGMKKGCDAPAHPLFERMEAWLAAWDVYMDQVANSLAGLKLELIAWANEELARRRGVERSRSFDDLLTDLGAALDHPATGPLLAAQVADSFSVALIDEFQDTDPTQYRIFRRCFVEEARPVFLVGDPKQAIYSFRGADIFAYLAARHDAERQYTLDTNRRSDEPLVATVNALFGRELPFLLDGIAYQPVAASPSSGGRLEVDDDRAPFNAQWLPAGEKELSKEAAELAAAEACADEIARLLTLAGEDRAAIVKGASRRRLAGGDIAVLVATHSQGDRVRSELRARGVASVALTQESVFASREAGEMLALLHAWAEPANEGRLRHALATELAGLDAARIQAELEDETRWERQLLKNADDHQRWREHGFMAAWRHYFARERAAERLLPLPDGERRLTNLGHLAELIQQESEGRQGMAPLLAWFAARVADPPRGEDAVLRLESDAALVKIVTVHTSKGLQYPVVFCPFLWNGALERRGAGFWSYHHGDEPWLAPEAAADDGIRQAARSEMLAEKLRLLYVALTRAQYRQYIAWGWVRELKTAALSWLLHAPGARDLAALEALELDGGTVAAQLRAFLDQRGDAARWLDGEGRQALAGGRDSGRAYAARPFERRLYAPWKIASFTSLTHDAGSHLAEAPDYDRAAAPAPAEPAADPVRDRFSFPRGAKAGVCLHEIFENIGFGDAEDDIRAAVQRALARHGFGEEWLDAGCDLILGALNAEIAPGARLRDVADHKRLIELEFTLPVKKLDVGALIAALQKPAHGLAEPFRRAAAELDFASVQGFLKGFVDLVCEADGRVYLIDYKSNHLGDACDDYRDDSLVHAVAREHYYLQYLIYLVALRRYFAARGADWDGRFGGVRYLFLRGMAEPGCGVWADMPSTALLDALDALLAGSGTKRGPGSSTQ